MVKEGPAENLDSRAPQNLAPEQEGLETAGEFISLEVLTDFDKKIQKEKKENPDLLANEKVQELLKKCEPSFNELTGEDLRKISKKDAHSYFEQHKKQKVYKDKDSFKEKVQELYRTINEAKKDKNKKVPRKDIKLYTYIENAWGNLSDKQKEEYASENDPEGKGAKFNFIVEMAKNRFKNIELNCQVNNVEDAVNQGGAINVDLPLSPDVLSELEEKDKNFINPYVFDGRGEPKKRLQHPESHDKTEHKKLTKELNDLILDQMYLFDDAIKEFGGKENAKAHDYFYQKLSKLKSSLPEASEKLENISLEGLEKSIELRRQKLEKYRAAAEGFRIAQTVNELKRERKKEEKAKALREYEKELDEPMDEFKEQLKRAGWATLSFVRHPIKGIKRGIKGGWSFVRHPIKFWSKPKQEEEPVPTSLERDNLESDESEYADGDQISKEVNRMMTENPVEVAAPPLLVVEKKEPVLGLNIQQETVASEVHLGRNEDAIFSDAEKKIAGVFDGMGGHAGGQIASGLAINYVSEKLKFLPENLSPQTTQETLKAILEGADELIYQHSKTNPELRGLGTTASIVKIWEGGGERKAIIGNVGDSRVYRYSNGILEQITLDDGAPRVPSYNPEHYNNENFLREMQNKFANTIDLDALNDDEKAFFERRNVISQNLGKSGIEPRMYIVDLKPNEKIIVMSDGVGDNLTDNEMAQILKEGEEKKQDSSKNLINAALQRSKDADHLRAKEDDMSVIVIEFNDAPRDEPVAPSVPEAGAPAPKPESKLSGFKAQLARKKAEAERAAKVAPPENLPVPPAPEAARPVEGVDQKRELEKKIEEIGEKLKEATEKRDYPKITDLLEEQAGLMEELKKIKKDAKGEEENEGGIDKETLEAALDEMIKKGEKAYSDLGISKDASDEDVDKAFRNLSREIHRNKNNISAEEVEGNLKKVNDAHDLIKNLRKKP